VLNVVTLALALWPNTASRRKTLPCRARQALESFVSRSPGAMRPHLQAVLPLTLSSLSFDPNYAEDMDADEDDADDDEDAVDECAPSVPISAVWL